MYKKILQCIHFTSGQTFYCSFFCRLPGEAMQIDRVMDCFAAHYCAQNPDIFEETDTCFILSFSIIMLNTALHNPNSKMKITSEQFIKQNKGINSGKDLAADMLDAIFRNIKEEPFKIPDENYDDLMYTFFSPEKEGWLLKQVCIFSIVTQYNEGGMPRTMGVKTVQVIIARRFFSFFIPAEPNF